MKKEKLSESIVRYIDHLSQTESLPDSWVERYGQTLITYTSYTLQDKYISSIRATDIFELYADIKKNYGEERADILFKMWQKLFQFALRND